MSTQLRITRQLLDAMRVDLGRPHRFAAERVGILYCRFASLPKRILAVLAFRYQPIPDSQYINDPGFGAVIGSDAFRDVIQSVHDKPVGAFHVHMHRGRGTPRPSPPDLTETAAFVPDFFHGRQTVPHGALILSDDSLSGRLWMKESGKPRPIDEIRIVGAPMKRIGKPL
jgi:hypothetical protein